MPEQARYDAIGKDYNNTRRPDERIVKLLVECLDLPTGSSVMDIGAGTGNYTEIMAELGHFVTAVEPSAAMISKACRHKNIVWKKSSAERIPLSDATFDAAYCTLSMHHFTNLEESLAQIFRVLKPEGKFVAFTADPRRSAEGFWMPQYFGPIYDRITKVFPTTRQLVNKIKHVSQDDNIQIIPFPLPYDIKDGFFCSSWRYPEMYYNPAFRQGISHFQLADRVQVQEMLDTLRQDIDSGVWDKSYGATRSRNLFECGYYFVSATKHLYGTAETTTRDKRQPQS